MTLHAIRGPLLGFRADPFTVPPDDALHYETDALILIRNGIIEATGPYATLRHHLPENTPQDHYPNHLITAGFIDTHVHYPQLPVIASYGEQLLTWLERYVFPTEKQFRNPDHAATIARAFLTELLTAGTTTAAVYCTVHPESVNAFFQESERLNTRMIAGKVLMDRNAPPYLRDTAQTGYDDSAALIRKWHRNGRQLYAVTPRFAPTSTEEQLDLAGTLLKQDDSLFMQTHLLETVAEEEWVRSLFPNRRSYLDVYDHAGLLRPRSIFGHAVHAQEADFCRCHETGSALSHCPTSNMFLGSGHFRLFDALRPDRRVKTGIGSDVAGGNALSMLRVLNDAYKVAQIQGQSLHPAQALWLATVGGAQALGLENTIGRIAPGMEADIVVLNPRATSLQKLRTECAESVSDLLFALTMLGDDRNVAATYIYGRRFRPNTAGSPGENR